MVLGEIGEDTHGEGNALRPVLHQGVRGDLHHRMGAARVRHLAQQTLDLQGIRRGAPGREHLLLHQVLHRADEAGFYPCAAQDVAQEVGSGGFAVGTGDAQDRQPGGGVFIPGAGNFAQGGAHIRHRRAG